MQLNKNPKKCIHLIVLVRFISNKIVSNILKYSSSIIQIVNHDKCTIIFVLKL